MEAMMVIMGKVAVILILIAVGYAVTKCGWFTERGAAEVTSLLIKIVTPCLIVNSFLGNTGTLQVSEMLLAVVVSAVAIALSLVISLITFRNEPPERKKVLRFAVIFSNAGFMGIPLVESIVGGKGVIYGSFFIVVFNVICWTYGYNMMSGGAKMNLRTVLLNPGMIGLLFGLPLLPRFTAALVSFAINYACYFSEIYRGGIQSVPQGQYEAGQVLGMTRSQIFFRITLLQVVKRIVPPMSNEFITLVKDTALVRVISVYEIIWMGETFIKKGMIWPLFYTAVFYLVVNGILTLLFGWVEQKLDYFK